MPSSKEITLDRIAEIEQNSRMSRQELETTKIEKFRRLVRFAMDHSAYYSRIIRDRSIRIESCVPGDFPILTKSELMSNFDLIVTDHRITKKIVTDFLSHSTDPGELLLDNYRVLHTSGSSGEIGYFIFSERDWILGILPGHYNSGPKVRDMKAQPQANKPKVFRTAYYGAIGGHFAGVSIALSTRHFQEVGLFEVNDPLPQVIAQLNAFMPNILSGYTTAIKVLAEKQREGALRLSILEIRCAGEAMTAADKAYLEESFGCPASSTYACTEHLMMGSSNPDGRTMTLLDNDLIYEFFDDHSLITNLFNHTIPLIRYRMSDILRPAPTKDPTSPYLAIDTLIGRTEKIPTFINRDGALDFLHPISIVELYFPGITRFQMQLIDHTSFRFVVCLDASLTPAQRAESVALVTVRLRNFLDQKLMNNVIFEVVSAEDIPIDRRSRKFQLIVDSLAAA